MGQKFESKIDIAVLILFFNRPKMLSKVFEQVKIARPSKLYLFQDGARENRPDDIENVQKCREVVAEIDWDCEVHINYQEKNNGCDPSEYLAQKWMFETEEMGIILEDDDVPSQSFFPYCKELLEHYKNDQRINMVCGMNNLEKYDSPYDYVFTTTETITGWATWKRVIDEWVDHVAFLENEYYVEKFKDFYRDQFNVKKRIKFYQRQNEEGIAYYESILSTNAKMNSRLNIVPCRNLISNIGNEGESTHGASSLEVLPKGIRRIFNMKTYEYEFPLKHQQYVIEDIKFRKKLYRVMAVGHPFVRLWRRCESFWLRLTHGQAKQLLKSIFKRKK
ncbi:MAG: hemolysin activation protein [Clostridia bacterium]|nr:hemolysin activation protein [Clostridia bacterium]